MKVKLLKDVVEGGSIKTVIRKSRKLVIGFFAGTVVDLSEASAKKYIDSGLAEAYTGDEVAANAEAAT
jgi:hypothetical protein